MSIVELREIKKLKYINLNIFNINKESINST